MDRRTSSLAPISRRRLQVGALLLTVAALGYGCFERELKPVNPCTTSVQGQVIQVTSVDKVDLLLMIDNSNSMTEEQASIIREIPRVVEILTSGMDPSGAIPMFTPAHSLHIGIVDCDMGLGPISGIATCNPGVGDDGLMQTVPRTHDTGCATDYVSVYPDHVFNFDTMGTTTSADFAMQVGCVAHLGTNGCGFEFELDAPLKAISLSAPTAWTHAGYVPPTFLNGSYGHGDDPTTNGDFLRPDSALAVVTVNDEDDCSTSDYDIFALDDPMGQQPELNLRCITYDSSLYPIERYSQGFLGLRQNPALLIYGAITGIPETESGMPPATILLDPLMANQIAPPPNQNELVPVCSGAGGVAYPALRMTRMAQQIEAGGGAVTVHSICNLDFAPAFEDIIQIVSQALSGACLARELNPDADGNVNCDVLEALPIIGGAADQMTQHCSTLLNPDAYTLDHTETITASDGTVQMREVCRVHQVGRAGAGTDAGWAYDDGNPALGAWSALPMGCTQRIGFSVIDPVSGAEVRLQCDETILPSSHAAAQLGTACGASTTVDCSAGTAVAGNPMPLACDPFVNSCQIPCTTDANCTGAGLLSYVCDHRAAMDFFPADMIPMNITDPTQTHSFCVNPTCGTTAAD